MRTSSRLEGFLIATLNGLISVMVVRLDALDTEGREDCRDRLARDPCELGGVIAGRVDDPSVGAIMMRGWGSRRVVFDDELTCDPG